MASDSSLNDSKDISTNIKWDYNEGLKELSISGEGYLPSYGNKVPWKKLKPLDLTIKDGIKSISSNAFYEMGTLRNVYLPASLEEIESCAFYGCNNIAYIYFNDKLNYIGNGSFEKSGLSLLDIPSNVTSIGESAFAYCKELEKVMNLGSIKKLNNGTFKGCVALKDVSLPNSLTYIGTEAFLNCSGLSEIIIPEGVTAIGENAFKNCKGLKHVTLPKSLESINSNAFQNCTSLHEIILPENTRIIGDECFSNCSSLVRVTLSDSLTEIGKHAFENCPQLYSVDFKESNPVLADNAFKNDLALSEIKGIPDYLNEFTCEKYGIQKNTFNSILNKNNSNLNGLTETESPITPSVSEVAFSEIDRNIPLSDSQDANTIVLIISNQDYNKYPEVKYAINDGKKFAEYCNKTLGIPQENIREYYNATYGVFKEAIKDIENITDVLGEKARILFYYSGHGAPDTETNIAYLIPTDASTVNEEVCISLNEMYSSLAKLKTSSTIFFIDACFSGATRDGGMLSYARSVRVKPKKNIPLGNIISFCASSGDQMAMPDDEQGHGLFTYHLLKCINENKGNIKMKTLIDTVTKNVSRHSILKNRIEQTPSCQTGGNVAGGWEGMSLKQ